ncbi:MAG: hypothetical protein QXL51_07425, partial [Candidatus Aenigmatarchaeota archaeon]
YEVNEMEENIKQAEVQVEKSSEEGGKYYLYQIIFSVVPKSGNKLPRSEINKHLRTLEDLAQTLAGGYTLIRCEGGYTFEDNKRRVYGEETYILQIAGNNITTKDLRKIAAVAIIAYRQQSVVLVFPDMHTELVFDTEVEQIKEENKKEFEELYARGEINVL